MKFTAKITKGEIDFINDHNRDKFYSWAKKNEGIRLAITDDEPIGTQKRRFFEGAVVPYFAIQNFIDGAPMPDKEARKTLIYEFNPDYVIKLDGTKKRTGGSTKKFNDDGFRIFLERIEGYFQQNGYEYPSSVEFKEWEKTAPLVDEEFPPLARLKELAKNKFLNL